MDSPPSSVRRPCFAEEDDGLASIAEFSGTGGHHYNHINRRHHPIFSRTGNYSAAASTVVPRRTGSVRSLVALSTAAVSHCASPRSGRIYDPRFEEANHFLDACSLCKKPLGGNRDIFMYRDVPFCSEDCRQDQIQVDEAKEKSISLASMKAMRSKQKKDSSSPDKSQKYPFRAAGTVAAA